MKVVGTNVETGGHAERTKGPCDNESEGRRKVGSTQRVYRTCMISFKQHYVTIQDLHLLGM